MGKITVIGGGLAGSEAAYQCLRAGHAVDLIEMRPVRTTEAHQSGDLAELVCSNSLKSVDTSAAAGVLKEEMASFDSLIVAAAYKARVPAGQALAVDRKVFSDEIKKTLESFEGFKLINKEVTEVDESLVQEGALIVATGPLTAPSLAKDLREKFCSEGSDQFYFYDAIAPVVLIDSLEEGEYFRASRYDKGTADYLNVPLNKEEYETFISDIKDAEKMPLHNFEKPKYFESCLPIEVMADRGDETLRFGPMKPVGLTDPRTGRWPYACIQLRMENVDQTMASLVGFQSKMKWPEQKRIFSKIPAFKNAEFLRYGSIHRNTYLKSPDVLTESLSFKKMPGLFLAGQITGVEGYTESAAIGLLAGRAAAAHVSGTSFVMPPKGTALGALHDYVTNEYQPWLIPQSPEAARAVKSRKEAEAM
jgi:methylenetetrahydrofolate--tRNA-(uracil-5-)-methyltransferase